jgi:kinesin family protein 18/19
MVLQEQEKLTVLEVTISNLKLFTAMLGTTEQPGVMVLALRRLFEEIEKDKSEINSRVTLSYLEVINLSNWSYLLEKKKVYNENIRDLLTPGDNLDLREDALKGNVSIAGLTEFPVDSVMEVMTLLHRGNKNRTTEPTKANETSSRSHAVCQVSQQNKVISLLKMFRYLLKEKRKLQILVQM